MKPIVSLSDIEIEVLLTGIFSSFIFMSFNIRKQNIVRIIEIIKKYRPFIIFQLRENSANQSVKKTGANEVATRSIFVNLLSIF